MAEGGIDYSINMSGNFDDKITGFIASVKELNAQVKSLSKAVSGSGTRTRNTGAQKEADATRQTSKNLDEIQSKEKQIADTRQASVRSLNSVEASQKAIQKVQRDIQKAQIATEVARSKSLKTTDAQALAAKKIADAELRQAASAETIRQLREKGLTTVQQQAKALGTSEAAVRRITGETKKAASQSNKLLLSFRQVLFTVLRFQIARQIFSFITDSVKEMSRFNAEIESAQISMAALISTVGEVRDSTGGLVTGVEAFNTALRVSDEIVNQLRNDAARTEATFEGLIQAYQFAVGPGLAAGLNLDQIRQATLNLTRAATQLGVPVRGLNEEIRSILQGTIRIQNTRLSAIFTNEEIERAREAGNLFGFITERLQAQEFAASEASNSFKVLASNVQDSASIILSTGATEYFEELKGLLADTINLIQGDDGLDVLNPEAVEIVESVSEGLAEFVENIRNLVKSENVLFAIGQGLEAIGTSIAIAGEALEIGVNALSLTVTTLLTPLNLIVEGFSFIAGDSEIINGFLSKSLEVILSIAATTKIITLLQGAYNALATFTSTLWTDILTKQTASAAATKAQAAAQGINNGLLAVQNALLTSAVVKVALITGGLTLLLGSLAIGLAEASLASEETADRAEQIAPGLKTARDSARKLNEQLRKAPVTIRASQKELAGLEKGFTELEKKADDVIAKLQIENALVNLEGLSRDIAAAQAGTTEEFRKQQEELDKIQTLKDKEFATASKIADKYADTLKIFEEEKKAADLLNDIRKAGLVNTEEVNRILTERVQESKKLLRAADDEVAKLVEQRDIQRQIAQEARGGRAGRISDDRAQREAEALQKAQEIENQILEILVKQKQAQATVNAVRQEQAQLTEQQIKLDELKAKINEARVDAIIAETTSLKEQNSVANEAIEATITRLEAEQEAAQTLEEQQAIAEQIQTARIRLANQEASQKLAVLSADKEALEVQLKTTKDEEKRLKIQEALDIVATKIKINEELRTAAAFAAVNAYDEQSGALEKIDAQIEAAAAKRELQADIAERQFEIDRQRVENARKLISEEAKRAAIAQLEVDNQRRILEATESSIDARIEELKLREGVAKGDDLIETQQELNALQQERLTLITQEAEELRRLELAAADARRLASTNVLEGITSGLDIGFREFASRSGTLSTVIRDTVKSGLDGVADTFGQQVGNYLDPRKNTDWENAFADLFYGLAGDFATELTKQLLASQISSILQPGSDGPLAAAFSALSTALGINTIATQTDTIATNAQTVATNTQIATEQTTSATQAATGTATDIVGGAGGALEGLATVPLLTTIVGQLTALIGLVTAQTLANLVNTALLGGIFSLMVALVSIAAADLAQSLISNAILAVIQLFTILDAVTPFAKGGLVKGFADGGKVQGFADGGSTGGLRSFQKAHNIPKSDTVPAMLTPGEFVLVPQAVKKYGAGFLQALNQGLINPAAILGMPTAAIATGMGAGIKGFADGGMVSDSGTAVISSRTKDSPVTILPVMPANNATMNILQSGGREVFERGVNRTTLTGDKNATKEWK